MKSDNVVIRKLTPGEIRDFYYGVLSQEVIEAFGSFVSGKCVGVCGIMKEPSHFGTLFEEYGRCIGFLDVRENYKELGLRYVRKMIRYIKEKNIDIYVKCDSSSFPQAKRLLKILGFTPTGEMDINVMTREPIEVWKWQH